MWSVSLKYTVFTFLLLLTFQAESLINQVHFKLHSGGHKEFA